MATDIEKLVVQLSADFKSFEKALARQQGVANKQFNAIERRALQMNKNLDSIFSRSFRGLTAPIAGIGAVLGTREIANYADEWTVAGNKMAAASVVAGRQARTLSELNEIARETRSGISVTADLYAKLLRSTAGVAKSELEVAKATEIVNKAFKAGGAAGSEQAAGILQLAQGLGSGILQGDELRSVRENAPLLAQAIADYFGVTVAGLKELGSEGQLTSDKIFKAILSAQGKIDNAFSATNSTIAEGVTMVNNAMVEYVGTADASYGATSQLVAGLTILADNFDKVADAGLQVAAVLAGVLVGRSLAQMIRTLGLAGVALTNFTKALAAARTMGGLATAMGGLSAAAGPVGMIIGGAVVGSLAMYSSHTSDAIRKSEAFEKELVSLGLLAQKSSSDIDDAAEAIIKLGDAQAAQKIRSIADEIERLRKGGRFGGAGDELNALQSGARGSLWDDKADAAAKKEISELITLLQATQITAGEVRKRMDAIRTTPVSDSVKELADNLDRTAAKMEALNARALQLGAMPELDNAKEQLNAVIDDLDRLERREIITSEQRRNLEDALTKLRDTGEGAYDARAALATLGSLSFSTTLIGLDSLIGKVSVLYQEAEKASGAMARAAGQGSSSFSRGGRTRARQAMLEERQLNNEYVAGAKQRASLGKAQYDLEAKIAQVRAQSIKDGRKLTEAQIKEIAAAQLAGDAARSAEGKKPKKEKRERDNDYERLTKQLTDHTAAMIAETEVQRGLNPLIDDYGYAVEKARAEFELLNAAEKAGVEVTPKLRAEISATAEQFALATVEAAQLAEAQDKIRQNAEEMADFQKNLTHGMVDGFLQGKSAAEMFANALGKVADKLIEIGMNSIFDTGKGGFNIFGALGDLFGGSKDPWSGLRLARGGHVRGAGTSTSDSIPARLSDGEFVVNAKATKQNRALLEAINSGRSLALAGGGMATFKAPRMPILQAPAMMQQAQASGVHVTLGWSKDADGNIAPLIKEVSQQTFKQGIKQYDKGSAVRTSSALREGNGRGYMKR